MLELSRCPPILILGCGRSGTSIFGELFQYIAPYIYRTEPSFSDMLKWFTSGVAVKVPTESEGFQSDPGLSFNLDALREKAPNTIFFWIVRNPLDAVCSLRIGIQENWGHHPRPPDWRDWLHRPLVERCAHHWAHINSLGFDAIRDISTLVRFEDMIRSPLDFATFVLSQIGLPEEDHKEQMFRWVSRVQNTNNDMFVEAETSRNYSRPDHTVRIGRWRENLSWEEVRQVASIVGDTNTRFGYDLMGIG